MSYDFQPAAPAQGPPIPMMGPGSGPGPGPVPGSDPAAPPYGVHGFMPQTPIGIAMPMPMPMPMQMPPSSSGSGSSPSSQSTAVADPASHVPGDAGRSPTTSASNSTNGSVSAHTVADKQDASREPTVQAACLACREKHLKCDGATPCSRCVSSGFHCIYIASRRGYKGPRRGAVAANPNKRQATSPPEVGSDCPMLLGAASGSQAVVLPSGVAPVPMFQGPPGPGNSLTSTNMQLYQSYCAANGLDASSLAAGNPGAVVTAAHIPFQTLEERCLSSFYQHFHASHPFVLPRPHLLDIAKEGNIEPLLAAMRWVGSLYIDVGPARDGLQQEAYRLVRDPASLRDGFMVQALMVLIVGLDGSCNQEKAREFLGEVEGIALAIELNTRSFATLHGRGNLVLEESWRRTWWDLFVIDGMVAGVHRVTNFMLFDYPADVGLPCEEYQFISGNIPPPLFPEDLEDRDFSGDNREFSSFSYRIQCAQNLGKFMRTPPILSPEDDNLARVEALLTNWRLHLPQSKRDALHKNGQLDEMMFQAHMMLHATSIMLHQPHSQLDSSAAKDINSCAPHRDVASGDLFNTHTKHTISSAVEISKLITHRVPLLSHTHFFTCVVTLSSVVHLSKWALSFIPHDEDDLRQQIRLNIGALNKLSEVWVAAETARGQVKGVAQEIYQIKKQQQMNPQFWAGWTREEMMNSIAADESIFQEVESLEPVPDMLPLLT